MARGARTPEELETLLEDALIMGDRPGLRALLAEVCVLVGCDGREARGVGEAERLAWAWRDGGWRHLAGEQRVLQAHDTALIGSPAGLHVARRADDGAWRLAISRVERTTTTRRRT